MSVNVVDLVAEIEADLAKGVTDAKAVLPLVGKVVSLLELVEPIAPEIDPVVSVLKDVLAVVGDVLAKV